MTTWKTKKLLFNPFFACFYTCIFCNKTKKNVPSCGQERPGLPGSSSLVPQWFLFGDSHPGKIHGVTTCERVSASDTSNCSFTIQAQIEIAAPVASRCLPYQFQPVEPGPTNIAVQEGALVRVVTSVQTNCRVLDCAFSVGLEFT